MRQRINQLLLAVGMVAITALSVAEPPAGSSSGLSLLAPLAHLAAYFCIAAGLLVVFHDMEHGHFEAILIAAAFGAALELVQGALPYRSFGWTDIAVNTIGASGILLDHHVGAATWFIHTEDRLIERLLDAGA